MIRSFIHLSTRIAKNSLPASALSISTLGEIKFGFKSTGLLGQTPVYGFAKMSKKEKDKQKLDEEKKKAKQQIGDTSTFDLNPFEEKYVGIIQNLKQTLSQYRVGRLDPTLFSEIYAKVSQGSVPIQQLAQVAPKSSNSCVVNPYDHDNLEAIQKAIQMSDLGFQVSKVDKTILVVQPPNSMKQIKEKMLEKLKKNNENYKQKMSKVRTDSREDLKKYKKIIPEERYKIIEKELTSLHEKFVKQMEKTIKDKETELKK